MDNQGKIKSRRSLPNPVNQQQSQEDGGNVADFHFKIVM